MDVSLMRGEVKELANVCNVLSKTTEKLPFAIVYAVNKTRLALKASIMEINEEIALAESISKKLSLDFCLRDSEGKPVYSEKKEFCGLDLGQQPEYDAGIDALNKKMQEYMKEKVTVKIHTIEESSIPNDLPTDISARLCLFLKDSYE